jgi:uncharacterized protein (DUF983 family)
MLEKNCPHCTKPISVFSPGMLKGKFPCPHCGGKLVSRPNVITMAVAGGIGAGIGVVLNASLLVALPIAIVVSYPFSIQLAKE